MFDELRQIAKTKAKTQGLTYAGIANAAGFEECTIKSFMSGVSDSRRVAEKVADVLGLVLVYENGTYRVETKSKKEETS